MLSKQNFGLKIKNIIEVHTFFLICVMLSSSRLQNIATFVEYHNYCNQQSATQRMYFLDIHSLYNLIF